MKDAQGHGSNPRGATASHQSGVQRIGSGWTRVNEVWSPPGPSKPPQVSAPEENIALGSVDYPRAANVPSVDWSGQDLQDSSKRVDENTIRRDYVPEAQRKSVDIYRAYVPIEDIPSPKLAEVESGDEEGYDWSGLSSSGSPPPVKLEVDKAGEVHIVDGNHRLRFWEDRGHSHAPAYVIDHRRNVKHNNGDDDE